MHRQEREPDAPRHDAGALELCAQLGTRQVLTIPETAQTHCYFEAASKDAVKEANQRARIPFTLIAEVVEMTPDSV